MTKRTYDDLITIGATGIRQQLLSDPDLLAEVSDLPNRVGLSNVDANTPLPYIRMELMWGINENKTPRKAFDMYWVVEAVSTDQAEAGYLSMLVKHALEWVNLNYPGNWVDYAGCTYSTPHADQFEIQGHEYFAIGGTFRLRGALGA